MSDVFFTIWDGAAAATTSASVGGEGHRAGPVGYVAHFTGAVAGLAMGFLVLKNGSVSADGRQRLRQRLLWWTTLSLCGACTTFAVIWNVVGY